YSIGAPLYLEEYYNITVRSRANAAGETFIVQYSLDGGMGWLEDWSGCAGIVNDTAFCEYYTNVSSSSITGILKIRFMDWGDDDSINRSLLVDYVNLTGYTPPGKDLDISMFFDMGQKPAPGDSFVVSMLAYYDDDDNETCAIWAKDWNTGMVVPVGHAVHGGNSHDWTTFSLPRQYASATGEVEIRFKPSVVLSGEATGTLSIDYIYARYKDTTTLNHTWYTTVDPGAQTVFIEASRTANPQEDDFQFYWSPNNSTWYMMAGVLVNTTDKTLYAFSSETLNAHTGTVYIQARDTNRDANESTPATLHVYMIYINTTRNDSTFTSLSHTWSFDVPATATSLTFHVWARRDDTGAAIDNFQFYWSPDNTAWNMMTEVLVTGTAIQQYDHPFGDAPPTGTVYVRVTNTNNSLGKTDLFSAYVDHMYFSVGQGVVLDRIEIPGSAGYKSVGAGDVDGDGVVDISAARNGLITIFRNDDQLRSVSEPGAWSAIASPGGLEVLKLSAGYERQTFIMADMNGDGYADFVASGTVGGSAATYGLYMWLNMGDGTYNRILVKDLFTDVRGGATDAGDILCMDVGPTDGWSIF
ncbi:MAG: FG-GAP-like repeat-containing protein, partial [Candidatus Thermoplasmatota archaeon]|nr:FG-GAP-like repeat-containing protein [Candidatus Thermoplasmatota archaeon]